MENDNYKDIYLKRLRKLRKLVTSDMQKTQQQGESDDMTIVDYMEWLQEINAEILNMSK